jgi:hypothetical protein
MGHIEFVLGFSFEEFILINYYDIIPLLPEEI